MKKGTLLLSLLLALTLLCGLAAAQENTPEDHSHGVELPPLGVVTGEAAVSTPLTYEELLAWRNGFALYLREMEILNSPIDTYNPEYSDDYLIEVEYGTVDSVTPNVTDASQIAGVEITDGMLTCPRGLSMGSSLDSILGAYPNENPELAGSEGNAILYAYDVGEKAGLNEAVFGVLLRDGPTPVAVQYTTLAPVEGGQFLELGIQYILDGGYVVGMRFYGFNSVISADSKQEKMATVKKDAATSDYTSSGGPETADILMLADLRFGDLFLPTATVDQVVAEFGEPEEREEMTEEEDGGTLVTLLVYPGMTFEFTGAQDARQLTAFTLSDEDREGPRGLAVGMDLDDALSLFRREGQAWQDNLVFLYAHGEAQELPPFGMLEYYSNAEATLRYSVMGDDDAAWMLHISILDSKVDEILIYRYVP